RVVHGDAALGHRLLTEAYERGHRAAGFAKLLAEIGETYRPPVNFLGGFKTEFGRLDLKKGGLLPVVTAARVLAIRHNIVRRATRDRLDAIRGMGIGWETDIARLNAAHETILKLILRQQVTDSVEGHPLSSSVRVKSLDRVETEELRSALTALGHAAEITRDLMFA
ncbi:MAG TPA: putative nucleotidyltransferase substrate binding domain-containing protein, partial [Hyphomicrobiales bacterium]|nr:putative nucleotidyltransferase substrate binding domain-containing protein [Hyphomicrobiales bacterium]